MLGHCNVAFTMQVYAHVLNEARKGIADKMEAILKSRASPDILVSRKLIANSFVFMVRPE